MVHLPSSTSTLPRQHQARARAANEDLPPAEDDVDTSSGDEGGSDTSDEAPDFTSAPSTPSTAARQTTGGLRAAGGSMATAAAAFEDANVADGPEIVGKLHQITLPFNTQDVRKWLKRLEVKMETYGVTSQWAKRIVLENNLPSAINDELEEYLVLSKAEASATIYKDMKALFLKAHGPIPESEYRKAQTMVMVGTPSQTARRLAQLMCRKPKKLTDCCCAVGVSAIWRDLLPQQIKSQVANLSLEADHFEATIAYADSVYQSLQPAQPVAAVRMTAPGTSSGATPKSTDAGASDRSVQEVAAVKKRQGGGGAAGSGKKPPRKKRDPNDPTTWGKPHADGPPAQTCMYHYVYGRKAYFCSRPESCPWKHLSNPPKHD